MIKINFIRSTTAFIIVSLIIFIVILLINVVDVPQNEQIIQQLTNELRDNEIALLYLKDSIEITKLQIENKYLEVQLVDYNKPTNGIYMVLFLLILLGFLVYLWIQYWLNDMYG